MRENRGVKLGLCEAWEFADCKFMALMLLDAASCNLRAQVCAA